MDTEDLSAEQIHALVEKYLKQAVEMLEERSLMDDDQVMNPIYDQQSFRSYITELDLIKDDMIVHLAAADYSPVEKDVDISDHRSQSLTREMAESANLILVMENNHKRFIKNILPDMVGKTFLLKEFGKRGHNLEVADPIGGDLDIYRTCYEEMETEILRILPEIIARSHQK